MTLLTIDAKIWVESDDDPEDVALQMNLGLKGAVEHFPGAEVLKAGVQKIYITPDEEKKEEALDE